MLYMMVYKHDMLTLYIGDVLVMYWHSSSYHSPCLILFAPSIPPPLFCAPLLPAIILQAQQAVPSLRSGSLKAFLLLCLLQEMLKRTGVGNLCMWMRQNLWKNIFRIPIFYLFSNKKLPFLFYLIVYFLFISSSLFNSFIFTISKNNSNNFVFPSHMNPLLLLLFFNLTE